MKKKTTHTFILSLVGILLVLISCERMLDLPNDSLLPEEEAYLDEYSARSAVMGVYARLQEVSTASPFCADIP